MHECMYVGMCVSYPSESEARPGGLGGLVFMLPVRYRCQVAASSQRLIPMRFQIVDSIGGK